MKRKGRVKFLYLSWVSKVLPWKRLQDRVDPGRRAGNRLEMRIAQACGHPDLHLAVPRAMRHGKFDPVARRTCPYRLAEPVGCEATAIHRLDPGASVSAA